MLDQIFWPKFPDLSRKMPKHVIRLASEKVAWIGTYIRVRTRKSQNRTPASLISGLKRTGTRLVIHSGIRSGNGPPIDARHAPHAPGLDTAKCRGGIAFACQPGAPIIRKPGSSPDA